MKQIYARYSFDTIFHMKFIFPKQGSCTHESFTMSVEFGDECRESQTNKKTVQTASSHMLPYNKLILNGDWGNVALVTDKQQKHI